MKRMAICVMTAFLFASGCGVDDPPADTKEATVQPTLEPDPIPTEDFTFQLGETASTSLGSVRLLEVRNPTKGQEYDTPSPGKRFISIRLKQCAAEDADGDGSTFVGEWFFLDNEGGEYSSNRTMHGWPNPEFPQGIELSPGQCKAGWMALEIKSGIRFESVVYRLAGSGQEVAVWSF